MQPENINLEQKNSNVFNEVTPLSKYLAMALFVILPFIGGWIGYKYAPEKIVEVEKVVVKEVNNPVIDSQLSKMPDSDTQQSNKLNGKYLTIVTGFPPTFLYSYPPQNFNSDSKVEDLVLYKNEIYGFSFLHEPNFEIEELSHEDFDSQGFGKKTYDSFALIDLEKYQKIIPGISVYKNFEKMGILDQLNSQLSPFTSNLHTLIVDGRPAFYICSAEAHDCSIFVVTDKFIFRIDANLPEIKFDEMIAGTSEKNVNWPQQVQLPARTDI